MIYRFRVTLNGDETTFRDIEVEATDTFEDLHNAILQSFGFDGMEMASFYLADEEWEPLEEITLFDMSEDETKEANQPKKLIMQEVQLEDMLHEEQTRSVYIYDFLNLWTFMVELAQITEKEENQTYPNLLYAQGQLDFGANSEEIVFDHDDPYALNDDEMNLFDDNGMFEEMDDDFDSYDSYDEDWN